jgi:hypothetical protein
MKECVNCVYFNDYWGCDCPYYDKWYACPIDSKKPENIRALKGYAEQLSKAESEVDDGEIH